MRPFHSTSFQIYSSQNIWSIELNLEIDLNIDQSFTPELPKHFINSFATPICLNKLKNCTKTLNKLPKIYKLKKNNLQIKEKMHCNKCLTYRIFNQIQTKVIQTQNGWRCKNNPWKIGNEQQHFVGNFYYFQSI